MTLRLTRPRHRLPRRHPRRLHGRARLRGPRPRRRRRPRSSALAAGEVPVLRARASTELLRKARRRRPAAVHRRRTPRPRRSATCTSSASAPRRRRASTPPTCATSTPRSTRSRRTSTGPALVVGKSTVPVGTAAAAGRAAAPSSRRPATRVELAWNPEFLREGFAVEDTLQPDRLVFGVGVRARPRQLLREVYAPRDRRTARRSSSPTSPTAELVKVAANSFLATKISFINAMAEVCEATGADVDAARRRARRTTTGSAAGSSTPGSASAAAACPRTSARSWPAPGSSASTRR